jgi:hypothetical protein
MSPSSGNVDGGTGCHFAHYPGCPHSKSKETPLHSILKRALAWACDGSVEIPYGSSDRKADAGNGTVFYEVVVSNDITREKAQALVEIAKAIPGFCLFTVKSRSLTEQDVREILTYGHAQAKDDRAVYGVLVRLNVIEKVDLEFIIAKKQGEPWLISSDENTVSHGDGLLLRRRCGACLEAVHEGDDGAGQMKLGNIRCGVAGGEPFLRPTDQCTIGWPLSEKSPDFAAQVEFDRKLNGGSH